MNGTSRSDGTFITRLVSCATYACTTFECFFPKKKKLVFKFDETLCRFHCWSLRQTGFNTARWAENAKAGLPRNYFTRSKHVFLTSTYTGLWKLAKEVTDSRRYLLSFLGAYVEGERKPNRRRLLIVKRLNAALPFFRF